MQTNDMRAGPVADIKAVVAAANRTLKHFRGKTQEQQTQMLARLIAGADVAIGVYNDPEMQDGAGTYFIKGESLLERGGPGQELQVVCIPCREWEEAVAMSNVFGDGVGVCVFKEEPDGSMRLVEGPDEATH